MNYHIDIYWVPVVTFENGKYGFLVAGADTKLSLID